MYIENSSNLPVTFTIVQCTILPSEDMEKKLWLFSKSSFCQRTWSVQNNYIKFIH